MTKTLTIEFAEYPDETVEVRISPVPIRDFFKVQNAGRALRIDEESFAALAEVFAPFVESWSYPEPVSAEALLTRDYNWFIAVVNLWIKGVRDVPLPLPLTSSDGVLSEDQTTSPTSSPEPTSSTPS